MKWTKPENKNPPLAPLVINTPAEVAAAETAAEERHDKWELGHELAVTNIHSRLENNLMADLEYETNAYDLWEKVVTNNKPKGSDTLNDLYRQLITFDLKDATDFASRLNAIHIDITNIAPRLKLETNFLIFLFHTGLGKAYNTYFTHYTRTHKPNNEDNTEPAYSFEYATNRFIQTPVNHPSSCQELTGYAFAATPTTPFNTLTLDPQKGSVPGPDSRMQERRVKWCTTCKKAYHTKVECDGRARGSGGGGGGGGGGGNRGGNKGNSDEKGGNSDKLSKDNDKDKEKHKDDSPKKRARRNISEDAEVFVAFTAETDSSNR